MVPLSFSSIQLNVIAMEPLLACLTSLYRLGVPIAQGKTEDLHPLPYSVPSLVYLSPTHLGRVAFPRGWYP